jgi:hypothetical protein
MCHPIMGVEFPIPLTVQIDRPTTTELQRARLPNCLGMVSSTAHARIMSTPWVLGQVLRATTIPAPFRP